MKKLIFTFLFLSYSNILSTNNKEDLSKNQKPIPRPPRIQNLYALGRMNKEKVERLLNKANRTRDLDYLMDNFLGTEPLTNKI